MWVRSLHVSHGWCFLYRSTQAFHTYLALFQCDMRTDRACAPGLIRYVYRTFTPVIYHVLLYTERMSAVKTRKNITYRCHYHVAWCPKYRRSVLTSLDTSLQNPPIEGDPGPVDERLREIIYDVCREHLSEVLELEIKPDHVLLLVDCDPQLGIAKLVRTIKGQSSRLLRQEFPSLKRRLPTLWTNSYFVATVGSTPVSAIKQYIENQRNV